MIITFMGNPGGGKTYEAMLTIIHNLKKGMKVYTNIEGSEDPVCREAVRLMTNLHLHQFDPLYIHISPEQVRKIWTIAENNSCVVIDEIHEFFSNRDWNTPENKGFCIWVKKHRHQGHNILMLTTDIEGVDSQVRRISDWTYVYNKISYFGSAVKNKYEIGAYRGDATTGKPYQKWYRAYDHKIFACYKSYITADIKELNIQKTNVNILKHPVFVILPLAVIFCIYMISKSSIFGGGFLGVQKKAIASVEKKKDQPAVKKIIGGDIVEFRDKNIALSGLTPVESVPTKLFDAFSVVKADYTKRDQPLFVDANCISRGSVIVDDQVIELSECAGKNVRKINGDVVHVGVVHSKDVSLGSRKNDN